MHIDGAGSGRPLVLGHRGASADAPENTLVAFRTALEQGADGVELDVWRCGTGEVVVHHDRDVRRTAGADLRISTTTLSRLRRLDVGGWKGDGFRGERIPTLREVLDALPEAFIDVELKSSGFPDLALPGAVVRQLRDARAQDRCVVSSFDDVLLAMVRLLAPEIACGLLFADQGHWRVRERVGTALLRPRAVHPQATLVTADRVRAWSERGLDVNVWTVDEAGEIARLASLGVSAIITNRPAVARQALARDLGRR